ncbi:MAG: hypothetical protein ACREOV_05935 [Candidatus Dormibacteraceae bacterium]
MPPQTPRRPPLWTLGIAVAACLLLAACGSSGNASGSSSKQAGDPNIQALPGWAYRLHVRILSPQSPATVTQNEVTLQLAFSGYTPSCLDAGTPPERGEGHYHVLLDGTLVDMFCTPAVTISFQNVPSGHHSITVVPALNNHVEVTPNAADLRVDYQPASPLPTIPPAAKSAGRPAIQIVSPATGTRVSGLFTMSVAVQNFQLSCPLLGKPPVAGYGAWNLNLDSLNGPSGGANMATMARISCVDSIQLSTQGIPRGQHAFIAYLVNTRQQPVVPLASAQVVLDVG